MRMGKMREMWSNFLDFVEALSNFVFAMMAFLFIPTALILVPLYKWSKPKTGWGWDDLFLWVALVIIFVVASILIKLVGPEELSKFRRGEVLPFVFRPIRNVASIIGIIGVTRIVYLVIYQSSHTGEWFKALWKLLISTP